MALFQVPGWSVPTPPIRETSSRVSKKRKRPSDGSHKFDSAEVNIEKLMSQLTKSDSRKGKEVATAVSLGQPKKKKRKCKETTSSVKSQEDEKNVTTSPSPTTVSPLLSRRKDRTQTSNKSSAKKKAKVDREDGSGPTESAPTSIKQQTPADVSLTALQKSMKDKLDGARFRFANSYTQHSVQLNQD